MIRRASRQAITAVRTRGRVTRSPRRQPVDGGPAGPGQRLARSPGLLCAALSFASPCGPRAIEVRPSPMPSKTSHGHGRRAARVNQPAGGRRVTRAPWLASSYRRNRRQEDEDPTRHQPALTAPSGGQLLLFSKSTKLLIELLTRYTSRTLLGYVRVSPVFARIFVLPG